MGIRGGAKIAPGTQQAFGCDIPAGWLECNGAAVLRAAYPALFNAIGTRYGAGDGATTFNLPDKRGRGSISRGQGSGLTNRTQGQKIGAETSTLTAAQMPAHQHSDYYQASSAATNNLFASSGTPSKTGVTAVNEAGASTATGWAGSGNAHSIMTPAEVDIWGIKY